MWLTDGGLDRHVKRDPQSCQWLFSKFKEDVSNLADGTFLPGHKRFVETLRGNLQHDPEFKLVRLSNGNAVRRRALIRSVKV